MAPRTEQQWEEIREIKRAHIVETALELFAYEGYSATSISMIAQKAGISKGLMYNYFSGKEELLRAVLIFGIHKIMSAYGGLIFSMETNDDMKKAIDISFDFALQNKKFWLLYYSLVAQPVVYEKYAEELGKVSLPVMSTLQDFFKKRGTRYPETEALLFHSMLDGVFMHYLIFFQNYPTGEIKELIYEKFGIL